MIPQPAKAQAHVAREHPGVRALVHGWRHTCSAHMRVEGVAVALVSGLDSCDPPSALSVPRAPSSHRAALESAPRCSAAPRLCNRAVAAADHWILGGLTRTAAECEPATSEMVQDHHSAIV